MPDTPARGRGVGHSSCPLVPLPGTGYWHVAGTPVVEYAAMGWDECLTELLVQLGDRGLVAIVKMDGERQRGRWTVLVSGKPLGAEPGQWEPVRWDGDDLDAGLSSVLSTLNERVPGLLD